MKYWNKNKKVRERCWHRVDKDPPSLEEIKQYINHLRFDLVDHDTLKVWCQQQHSTGRFYHRWGDGTWYFELHDDAMWFKLKWT